MGEGLGGGGQEQSTGFPLPFIPSHQGRGDDGGILENVGKGIP